MQNILACASQVFAVFSNTTLFPHSSQYLVTVDVVISFHPPGFPYCFESGVFGGLALRVCIVMFFKINHCRVVNCVSTLGL